MLTHKGTQILTTERLTLRKIRKDDYKDMFVYTQKPEVAKYVSWSVHKNKNDTKKLCKMWEAEYKNTDRYNWAIVFGGKVIGNIDVVAHVGDTALLGWQIDSTHWNKGIMTEAASAVRDFLFDEVGFERLESCHISVNIGSGRVMQKIGMKEIPFEKSLHYQLKGETEADGLPLVFYELNKADFRLREETADEETAAVK